MSTEQKIVISHDYPPIPSRAFDWCAYREGNEEEGLRGHGPSAQAAIDELLELEGF